MRIEHWLYSIPLRLRSLFRRTRVEQDLDDELQFHLERKIEEYTERGFSPEAARQAALRDMDGLTQRKEECRDARRVNLVENTVQDIRYAFRVLRKSPGFAAVAVLTLALAIGANSVTFGVLNALLLRPMNLPDEGSLYSLQRATDKDGRESYPTYVDLRDRNRSFDGLAAHLGVPAALDTGDSSSRVWVQSASGNYFDVLRIKPHLGRFFHAEDEHGPNSAPYVVLAYGYWRSHFNDDPGVIGRVVRINQHPFTIIGVTPPEFHGTVLFFFPDLYTPMVNHEQVSDTDVLNTRGMRYLFQIFGHLKPGVTKAQAAADLNAIGAWVEQNYPQDAGTLKYELGRPALNGDFFERPITAFAGGLALLAGLILLAACANLGSLFAARAADRGREVALRLALGASRSRILRQLLTEAILISLAGGVVGLAGSIALLRNLSVWQPLARMPLRLPVYADEKVYLAALALAILSGLLFGLVPIRQVQKADPYQVIKAGPTGMAGRRLAMRDVLLVAQVAICALLVTSSMVAVRGLERSLNGRFGVEPRGAMLANVQLEMSGYRGEAVPAMQKRMLEAMQAIPGVSSAALTTRIPLDPNYFIVNAFKDETIDLRPKNSAARPYLYQVSPGYFRAAETALVAGREIDWHDDARSPRVAVINREFARRVFGSESATLGRHFKLREGTRLQVVGIAENGKYTTLTEAQAPAMFLPLLQAQSTSYWAIVRSGRDPQELSAAIRHEIRELDRTLPAIIMTWQQDLEGGALFPARLASVSLGIMGILGSVLAVTGIFGMAAYSVSKRTKELGIRMALGARSRQVLQAGLGRALKLLAVGSTAGMILGVLSSKVLAFIVFQATPRDPVVLGGIVVSMVLLGGLAALVPARRALSLDPARLLREE